LVDFFPMWRPFLAFVLLFWLGDAERCPSLELSWREPLLDCVSPRFSWRRLRRRSLGVLRGGTSSATEEEDAVPPGGEEDVAVEAAEGLRLASREGFRPREEEEEEEGDALEGGDPG
jgi:hypothetical protein